MVAIFRPNKRPPSFNFQKTCWENFAFYFASCCLSAEVYASLSLSSAAALFTLLTLNAAKSFIPFGRIKRHSKARWFVEVEEAVSERRKDFSAAHRSNEDRQAFPFPDVLRLSLPRPRIRHGRRLALLSRPNQALNLCTLSFVLSLALFPPLLTCPTVPLPGSRLQSSPIA